MLTTMSTVIRNGQEVLHALMECDGRGLFKAITQTMLDKASVIHI